VPVDSDLRGEATVGEDGLHHTACERGAVQAAVVLGHRDVQVDQRLLLYDVVCLVVVIGLLKLVRLLAEKGLPHGYLLTKDVVNMPFALGPAPRA